MSTGQEALILMLLTGIYSEVVESKRFSIFFSLLSAFFGVIALAATTLGFLS